MKLVGKEDGSRIGGPPQDGLVVVVPGKDTVAVGFEQSLWDSGRRRQRGGPQGWTHQRAGSADQTGLR